MAASGRPASSARPLVVKSRMRVIIVAALIYSSLCSCSKGPVFVNAPFDGSKCEIDIGALKEGQVAFYSLSIDGREISFFIVNINNDIQSYFNGCRECYAYKAGLAYEEGYMRCRQCNERWSLQSLTDGTGNCHPVPLKGTVKGNKYIITRDTIMEGIRFFQ